MLAQYPSVLGKVKEKKNTEFSFNIGTSIVFEYDHVKENKLDPIGTVKALPFCGRWIRGLQLLT